MAGRFRKEWVSGDTGRVLRMNNEYDEVGATKIFFVWSNQSRANILLNPLPCRGYIANDTGELIFFDKDLNPYILSTFSRILVTATEPSAPSVGECVPWFDLNETDPYEKVKLKFSDGTNKGRCIPTSFI
jgi:hypothetical protein